VRVALSSRRKLTGLKIKRILEERDILFVSDEVICGFGRLGEWFGSSYYGMKPDLMPIAKGLTSGYLPMGGVLVSDRVVEGLDAGRWMTSTTATPIPDIRSVPQLRSQIWKSLNAKAWWTG
jgi:acetylornithine/succinyldiaminopimelate/putrescine aminotransferase